MASVGNDQGVRIRIGVGLWIVSFFPLAALLHSDTQERLVIWTIQFVIGIVGLAIAGTAVAEVVKAAGWRHAPRAAWRSFLTGRPPLLDVRLPDDPGSRV